MGLELAKAFITIRGDGSKLAGDLGRAEPQMVGAMERIAGKLKGVLAGIGFAMLGRRAMALASSFETMNLQFEVMLGSAKEANKVTKDLIKFADVTPFELSDIMPAARGLIQFGERGDEMMETMRALGDAAAGTNSQYAMLALIFNQVRGVGKLLTQDFRQLSTRGVLSLQDIADHFGVTLDAAQKMLSGGKVSFKDLRDILIKLTGEGGRFENMMERMSKTFEGRVSTMKDAVASLLRDMGGPLIVGLKPFVDNLIALAEMGRTAFSRIREEVAKFEEKTGGLLEKTVKLASAFLVLRGSLWVLKRLLGALGIAKLTQAFRFLAIAGVAFLGQHLLQNTRAWRDLTEAMQQSMQRADEMIKRVAGRQNEFLSALEKTPKFKLAEVIQTEIAKVEKNLTGLQQQIAIAKQAMKSHETDRTIFGDIRDFLGFDAEMKVFQQNLKEIRQRMEQEKGFLDELKKRLADVQKEPAAAAFAEGGEQRPGEGRRTGIKELGLEIQDILLKAPQTVEEKQLAVQKKQLEAAEGLRGDIQALRDKMQQAGLTN